MQVCASLPPNWNPKKEKPGKAGGRLAGVLGPGADAEKHAFQRQRIRVHESGEALRASAAQDYCCP
jgi:hypothetical protein